MKTIEMITVTDEIANIIDNNVRLHPELPMTFIISDSCNKTNRMKTKAAKLQKVFAKMGAEVTVIGLGDDSHSYMDLLVEITDPVAGSLEKYLA